MKRNYALTLERFCYKGEQTCKIRNWQTQPCRASRAVLFDNVDTAKMHGLDTSNVSSRAKLNLLYKGQLQAMDIMSLQLQRHFLQDDSPRVHIKVEASCRPIYIFFAVEQQHYYTYQ